MYGRFIKIKKGYIMALEKIKLKLTELLSLTSSLMNEETSNNADIPHHPYKGEYVIVRSDRAGVFSGYLESYDSATKTVFLKESRRLFRWYGFTLSAVSQNGMISDKEVKVGKTCPRIMIETVIELIPCSDKAKSNLLVYPTYITDLDVK